MIWNTAVSLVLSLSLTLVTALDFNDRYDVARRYQETQISGLESSGEPDLGAESSLDYVTDSGICETTPGVGQHSGYFHVGQNMSMWFWFFEARHNPETAPLVLWLNGGPGCSSMMGLFQENGPCHFIDNMTEPTRNEHSWNNFANMLYVDQPIGTGFSYGRRDVNTTFTAEPVIWEFMQMFLKTFPKYKSRKFGLFTESYGGHYGPGIAHYFLSQNDRVERGIPAGQRIDLVALGINNGWIDPMLQYKAYAEYSFQNPYKQIIDADQYDQIQGWYNTTCAPALLNCTTLHGNDDTCEAADSLCEHYTYQSILLDTKVDFNVYDVRIGQYDVDPPETYVDYITRPDVAKAIGAHSRFAECDNPVYWNFESTGDEGRSYLEELSIVVQRNVTTLLWAGDADWICNWVGNLWVANALDWQKRDEFASMPAENYTVNGVTKGTFKTLDNLSWFRVFESGHEVPYYRKSWPSFMVMLKLIKPWQN